MLFRRPRKYKELESALGYRFRNEALLVAALTHRSYRFESVSVDEDNQRLEFLGDAILGFLAAACLYEIHQNHREGTLTTLRSAATSGKALAKIAQQIALGQHLRIGKGEERSGGRERPSCLADAFEAVIGAAYVDGGIKAADKIFRKLFFPAIGDSLGEDDEMNPKGRLQECAQRHWKTGPRYKVLRVDGPPHAQLFTVEASVDDALTASGTGSNKQAAETEAASRLLRKIEAMAPDPGRASARRGRRRTETNDANEASDATDTAPAD